MYVVIEVVKNGVNTSLEKFSHFRDQKSLKSSYVQTIKTSEWHKMSNKVTGVKF